MQKYCRNILMVPVDSLRRGWGCQPQKGVWGLGAHLLFVQFSKNENEKKNRPRGIDILCPTPPNPPKNTYNFMGYLKLLYIDYLRPLKDLYSFRRTCLTPTVAASFDLVHSDLIVYLKYEYSSVSYDVF